MENKLQILYYDFSNLQLWPLHFLEFHKIRPLQHLRPINHDAKVINTKRISIHTNLKLLKISKQKEKKTIMIQ